MALINKELLIIIYKFSVEGYCDSELMVTAHGEYIWREIEVGQTDEQECVYGNKDGFEGGTAQRTCFGHHMWGNYTGEACITKVTADFRRLAAVSDNEKRLITVVQSFAKY